MLTVGLYKNRMQILYTQITKYIYIYCLAYTIYMYYRVLYKKRSQLMEGRATVIIYCSPPPLSAPADQAEVSIQHLLHNPRVLP